MSVETQWTSATATLMDRGGVANLADGEALFRSRRVNGTLLWAFRFTVGPATNVGTGLLAFRIGTDSALVADSGPQIIYTPAPALALDSNVPNGGTDGVARLIWRTPAAVVDAGVGSQEQTLFLVAYFSGSRMARTVPHTWARGDSMTAGNALESFDN